MPREQKTLETVYRYVSDLSGGNFLQTSVGDLDSDPVIRVTHFESGSGKTEIRNDFFLNFEIFSPNKFFLKIYVAQHW